MLERLWQEFTQGYADIPWKLMAGMRDRLIHGYDQVNVAMLWRTITNDVPDLNQKQRAING